MICQFAPQKILTLENGAIGFDLGWPGEVKIEVKHISEGCNLETLADRSTVTIKVE